MLPDPLFLNVHMYGIMIAVGVLLCFGVLYFYGKKMGISPKFLDFIFYNGIVSIAVGFGSAALFQAVYNYIENPSNGFHFGQGITFIGGLIGGAASFLIIYFILRKRYKERLTDVISMLPCCILIAHGFGRIGCFFAGCCYGVETDSFLGVKFPNLPHAVYPTQLFEAAFLFIMFGICSYLVLKKKFRHNLSLYLITYGIFRFLIEYIRGDDRGAFLGIISPSQFWSILMVAAGVGVYFLYKYLFKQRDAELAQAKAQPTAELPLAADKVEDDKDKQ